MTSRREFLQAGLAAAAVPLTARARSGSAPMPYVPLYKILYDTRFAASIAFARGAAARGLAVASMAGDMTRFWYDDLYHRWQRGPAAIAGMTAHGALFCLERLAWEQRMRVVFRGEHSLAGDGSVAHRFEGSATVLPATVGAVAASEWATALAAVIASCPSGFAARRSVSARTVHSATLPPSDALFSWVIAPEAHA